MTEVQISGDDEAEARGLLGSTAALTGRMRWWAGADGRRVLQREWVGALEVTAWFAIPTVGEVFDGLVAARVKWFNEERGYGFLEREGETDIFLHAREVCEAGIPTPLREGEVLLVRVKSVGGRRRAEEVRRSA